MASTPLISETEAWRRLREHVATLNAPDHHLRELLKDDERCAALTAEFDGVLMDFARQRVTAQAARVLRGRPTVSRRATR